MSVTFRDVTFRDEQVLRAVERIAVLKDDWDDSGAPMISELILVQTRKLLDLANAGLPPALFPTARGGILFLWHMPELNLRMELELGPENQVVSLHMMGAEEHVVSVQIGG